MDSHLTSDKIREDLEKVAASSEIYDDFENVQDLFMVDGEESDELRERKIAILARMALDGKLDPPWQKNDEIEKK